MSMRFSKIRLDPLELGNVGFGRAHQPNIAECASSSVRVDVVMCLFMR
jgi:hypothetical protein